MRRLRSENSTSRCRWSIVAASFCASVVSIVGDNRSRDSVSLMKEMMANGVPVFGEKSLTPAIVMRYTL